MIFFLSTLAVWTSAALPPCPRSAAPLTAAMITRPARVIQMCFFLSFMTVRPPRSFALGYQVFGGFTERIRPDGPISYHAVGRDDQAAVNAGLARRGDAT